MTARKPATLGAGLIAKKGQAAPISATTTNPLPVAHAPIVPPSKKASKAIADTTAITVRLDDSRYGRLLSLCARNKVAKGGDLPRTHQDILVAALDAYLEANGG